jgi:cell wall-associated NlpC family hydrolase
LSPCCSVALLILQFKSSLNRLKILLLPSLPLFIRKSWLLKKNSPISTARSLTSYRFGGTSEAGFDCSGFIGYLFREEAGMNLPRSTREMINVDAPLVSRSNLEPGDLLFFATNGRRGRVSHAGIYLGDNQFIHSSSRRSGGVRIDSLGDSYWSKTFIEAKRALAMAPTVVTARK